jgi:F-type H+-transporting ATPase subunit b
MLIDWFTVGAQAVNFLMKRFLYQPVLAAIDAREQKIATELQRAADARTQAEKEREALQVQTQALHRQRDELLRAAAADADVQRQQLLEDARKESAQLRSKSMTALAAERAELKLQIVSRTRQETFALTRKTLAELADTNLEDRMLEVFMRRVGAMNDVQKALVVPQSISTGSGVAVLRSAFELTSSQRVNVATAFARWPCEGVTLQFESAPDLISGLELIINGRKLAWNIIAYLATVEQKAEELLTAAESTAIAAPDVQHAA